MAATGLTEPCSATRWRKQGRRGRPSPPGVRDRAPIPRQGSAERKGEHLIWMAQVGEGGERHYTSERKCLRGLDRFRQAAVIPRNWANASPKLLAVTAMVCKVKLISG